MRGLSYLTSWKKKYFCNDSQAVDQVFSNGNAVTVGEDGYALLAPYGDSHYHMQTKGGVKVVVQRITKQNAEQMVNAFNSVVGRVNRWLRGSPIYLGHPDDSVTGHKYPVKEPMGMFHDLQVRENGLYVRPMFNEKGAAILERPDKYFFSGRWPVKHTGEKDGLPVFEPTNVTSIGITRNPNLPTEMLNDSPNIMDKSKLIALLAKAGVTLSNEASDDQIIAELEKVNAAKSTAETQLANEKAAKDAALAKVTEFETTIANERKKQADELITERLASGAITAAEKDLWVKRLEANFVNEAPALRALGSKIKVEPNPNASGNRARNPVSEGETAASKIVQLTNERMQKTGKSYQECAQEVSDQNPDLVKAAFGAQA